MIIVAAIIDIFSIIRVILVIIGTIVALRLRVQVVGFF